MIILGALALTVGVPVALRGLSELQTGVTEGQTQRAFLLAESCIDDALLRLTRDASYAGSTQELSAGSCTVIVTGSGGTRSLAVLARSVRAVRGITARVDLSGPRLVLQEWRWAR